MWYVVHCHADCHVTTQVSSINYQAYSDASIGSTASDFAAFTALQPVGSEALIFGLSAASQCASLSQIANDVCPALRDCAKPLLGPANYISGIMVVDFDADIDSGFKVVQAAYQALSGYCFAVPQC